ncbi:MAG: CpaF family protein [Lachnospiraceae bacterium]|nr:CpaF family protein [Lachnospiraceae bacterium]
MNKYRQELMQLLQERRELTDEEIYALIDELLSRSRREEYLRLSQREWLRESLFNSVRKLDILQELIDDNRYTEIMVNGTDAIFTEENGRLIRWKHGFDSREKLEDIVQQIVAGCNRVANEASAIVDARLKNGARVNIVMPPVALNGPIITIRRFPDDPITIQDLITWNSITSEAASFLKCLVEAGYNIFISGGTGSGKTTFLNALSSFIPADERIITIEDNAELQIRQVVNLVRLEARKANEEGENAVTIRDLIRTSLRMRPDRIVVGEVRGEETIDMLQAMNTGHDGSLSTGHGNSPRDMLSRLETMVIMGMDIPLSAIRRQIASGIDIMVHLGRLRDKTRKVLEILEVDGYDPASGEIVTHTLFSFEEKGENEDGTIRGSLEMKGELQNRMKLVRAGISLE